MPRLWHKMAAGQVLKTVSQIRVALVSKYNRDAIDSGGKDDSRDVILAFINSDEEVASKRPNVIRRGRAITRRSFTLICFFSSALCSIGNVNILFIVITITWRSGIIENFLKKNKILILLVQFFSGGLSEKDDLYKEGGRHVKKKNKNWWAEGFHTIYKWCLPNPSSSPFSKKMNDP